MGETTSLCKWKKVVKNGVMAMTNMTLGEFSEVLFGYPHPENFFVSYNAMFSVSRARILSRPPSFYKKSISFVDYHPNPEEGH